MKHAFKLAGAILVVGAAAIPGWATAQPNIVILPDDLRTSSASVSTDDISPMSPYTCYLKTVPVAAQPIHLMASVTTRGDQGVAEATVLRAGLIEWVGTDLTANISTGATSVANTHIVWADYQDLVDVEVNSASAVQFCNRSSHTFRAYMTMIW